MSNDTDYLDRPLRTARTARKPHCCPTGEVNGNGPFDATTLGDGARAHSSPPPSNWCRATKTSVADLYERSAGDETRLLSTAKPDPSAPAIEASNQRRRRGGEPASTRGTAGPGSTVGARRPWL